VCIDSDQDQPMRTPRTGSPPSSNDEMSPPTSPLMKEQMVTRDPGTSTAMQVSEVMADNDVDMSGHGGKKKREERELMMAAQAEEEKLLDKDWREGIHPRRILFALFVTGGTVTDCSLVEEVA